jgi:hypothetical protein
MASTRVLLVYSTLLHNYESSSKGEIERPSQSLGDVLTSRSRDATDQPEDVMI